MKEADIIRISDVIPVLAGDCAGLTETVNARDLHEFLDIGSQFANWIKDRIVAWNFLEGKDFVVIKKSGNNSKGGPKLKEYHVSLDMAKELAMLQNNNRGKQARSYFIECERKLRESTSLVPQLPEDYPAALRALADTAEQLLLEQGKTEAQAAEIQAMIPDADFARQFLSAGGGITTTQLATYFGRSAVWLNKKLHGAGWQWKCNGQWIPTAQYKQRGYMTVRTTTVFSKRENRDINRLDSLWTPDGCRAVYNYLSTLGVNPANPLTVV